MPDSLSPAAELLRQNWQFVQEIEKNLGERSWKIKGWASTVWWAVIAYATTSTKPYLILYLIGFLLVVLVIDTTQRITQERFLLLSHEIEKTLTAIAVGDSTAEGRIRISTNVPLTRDEDIGFLFTFRRIAFWFPYAAVLILTIIAYCAIA